SKTRDNFTIHMGTTTQSVATATMIDPLQLVYSSIPNQKFTVGLMTFTFSTPFVWDGKSNIVVQTNWSNETGSGTSGEIRYHTTPVNRTSSLYGNDITAATLLSTTIANTATAPYIYNSITNTRP